MPLDLDQMEKDALTRLEWALSDACYNAKGHIKASFAALRMTFPLAPPPVVKRVRKAGPSYSKQLERIDYLKGKKTK